MSAHGLAETSPEKRVIRPMAGAHCSEGARAVVGTKRLPGLKPWRVVLPWKLLWALKLRPSVRPSQQGLGKVMEPIEFASTDFFLALMENLWHTLGHGA
jgi:hypothetical protein